VLTDVQTEWQNDISDFIICPMLCYSNGTDNKLLFIKTLLWRIVTPRVSFGYRWGLVGRRGTAIDQWYRTCRPTWPQWTTRTWADQEPSTQTASPALPWDTNNIPAGVKHFPVLRSGIFLNKKKKRSCNWGRPTVVTYRVYPNFEGQRPNSGREKKAISQSVYSSMHDMVTLLYCALQSS